MFFLYFLYVGPNHALYHSTNILSLKLTIAPLFIQIVPDRVVKEEEDEQEEEVLEVEEAEEQCEMAEEMKPEEESRSASPPPEQLYIQISKEEYV